MSSGRVTVIVPTYKHQDYLKCSILSILNSTIPVEVIIVPVASDQPTMDELGRLRGVFESQGTVKVVVSDKADPFYQMQLGLDNVETEFFTIIGSDDFMLPNAVRRMLEIAVWSNVKNPIVGLSYAFTDEHLNVTKIETLRPFSFRRMMKGKGVIPDTALVKTDNVRQVDGFHINGWTSDFDHLKHYAMYHRLIKLPDTQVILSPDIGCLYRQLPTSRHLTRYSTPEGIRLHRQRAKEIARFYGNNNQKHVEWEAH